MTLRRAFLVFYIFFCTSIFNFAQNGDTALVLPFENRSTAPGLDWIGEAFPEVLNHRLVTPNLFLVERADRLYAYDRLGIPAGARISRATTYRIAQQLDVDYVVLGWYDYDGKTFTAHAQLLDMNHLHLTPEMVESSPLPGLIQCITALAWDVQRAITPGLITSRNAFVASWPAIRLDAFENYIRGIIAGTSTEKESRLQAALRISPIFPAASLELGRLQFDKRDYTACLSTLSRVPENDPASSEAHFYSGMAFFYRGDYERAEAAFRAIANEVPLAEVTNNIGVAMARHDHKNASPLFQDAVDADSGDPDYRFNLAIALLRSGDRSGAIRRLKETLTLDDSDAEARSLLESLNAGQTPSRMPLERLKTNYDESTFRRLAWEIRQLNEQRLANADPSTHLRFHLQRGEQLFSQGVYSEAENEFRDALRQAPDNATAHLGLARSLEQLNAASSLIRPEVDAAIRYQPSAPAYALLGRLELRDAHTQAANDALQHALRLDPNDPEALALQKAISGR